MCDRAPSLGELQLAVSVIVSHPRAVVVMLQIRSVARGRTVRVTFV